VLILTVGHPLLNYCFLGRSKEITINRIDDFLVLLIAVTALGDWLVPNRVDGTIKQVDQDLLAVDAVPQVFSKIVLNVNDFADI